MSQDEKDLRFRLAMPWWGALCALLWLVPCVLLAVLALRAGAAEVSVPPAVSLGMPGLEEATKFADLARDKDIVWLSLMMTILAIGFSAWLVRRSFSLWEKSIKALEGLRLEMAARPCVSVRPFTSSPS
jgi:hypothetical protein